MENVFEIACCHMNLGLYMYIGTEIHQIQMHFLNLITGDTFYIFFFFLIFSDVDVTSSYLPA